MIEYDDNKRGKIKIVNVTEARANFAHILSDKGTHYLVTKNNTPLRVILDYDEFTRLRQGVSSQIVPSQENQIHDNSIREESFHESLASDEEGKEKRKKKSKSRVKGLLGATERMVRENGGSRLPDLDELIPEREEKKIAVGQTQSADEDFIETLAKKNLPHGEDDYFSTAEEESFIMPPDSEPVTVPTQEIEKPTQKADKAEKTRSPEEEEYFNKYKKLYDSFGSGGDAAAISEPDLEERIQEKVDRLLSSPIRETKTEEKMPDQKKSETSADRATVKKRDPQEQLTKTPQQENKNAMPSLKDLLKELDEEKLSDEINEEYGDKEIDELIDRITKD